MEINYEFRKRIAQCHLPGRRDYTVTPLAGEIVIDDTWHIVIPAGSGKVLRNSAKDLQDYFEVSMGFSVSYRRHAM